MFGTGTSVPLKHRARVITSVSRLMQSSSMPFHLAVPVYQVGEFAENDDRVQGGAQAGLNDAPQRALDSPKRDASRYTPCFACKRVDARCRRTCSWTAC